MIKLYKYIFYCVCLVASYVAGLYTDSLINRKYFPQTKHEINIQDNKFKKSDATIKVDLSNQKEFDTPDTLTRREKRKLRKMKL